MKSNLLLALTVDGDFEQVHETLVTLKNNVGFDEFDIKVIIDNSQDRHLRIMLDQYYGKAFDVYHAFKHQDFNQLINYLWQQIIPKYYHADYIFQMSNDYRIINKLNIREAMHLLRINNSLAQIAFHTPLPEHQVTWQNRRTDHIPWIEHKDTYITQPSIYPMHLTGLHWPSGAGTEYRFTQKLKELGYKLGYFGVPNQQPYVSLAPHLLRKEA